MWSRFRWFVGLRIQCGYKFLRWPWKLLWLGTETREDIETLVRANPLPQSSLLPPPRRRAGFTLVEIMTVMMVIAILLSVAAVGIQNIDRGQATTTAASITEALFDEARSAAVGKGIRARLLIHKELNDEDPEDFKRYLRRIYLAVEDTAQAGDAQGGGWVVIERSIKALPNGVYFSAEESERVADAIKVGQPGTMRIKLPGLDAFKECYYFEFNAEGVCIDSENAAAQPGAAVVLISGARSKNQEEPKILKNNKVGFVVWRNGRTSIFRSPKQIDLAR